tara:strand:- start:426 stop:845 length:420 start_codon:yes stop_codon:yes gene_type:complete
MSLQQTLCIIKPDAIERNIIGSIINILEKNDLKVIQLSMIHLTVEQARNFYSVHKGKPFYEDLVIYMTSNKVIVIVLEGENAVEKYRKIMGSTDPDTAKDGTIRKLFAESMKRNTVHGSDSLANAATEINFFFNNQQAK